MNPGARWVTCIRSGALGKRAHIAPLCARLRGRGVVVDGLVVDDLLLGRASRLSVRVFGGYGRPIRP